MKNDTIMQYFEWYLPSDGQHWNRLAEASDHLVELGISNVWMPPAFKATSQDDVGYGVYDLFDLGEFDQKGTVRTKYGTKDEYINAIRVLKSKGIRPIADVVLNHKAQADNKEKFRVLKMDAHNRQQPISEPYEIEGWTNFTFPGRQDQYDDFKWHWYHFSGTDYDASHNETGIYMILGEDKGWAVNESVDSENGNYDYLMFTDVDFSHPEVVANIYKWVDWFIDTTGVEGFRLDAIKHIDSTFMSDLMRYVNEKYGQSFYIFGEFWKSDYAAKAHYLEKIEFEYDLVDVGLHMNFFEASKQGQQYDLRTILNNTLMMNNPMNAVTFVDNHDTQRGQALESTVEDWFKPIAYAFILLRQRGLPCVFYGDYYGIEGEFAQQSFREILDKLLIARKEFAYGEQRDYFDDANCIAWVRLGDEAHHHAMAVIVSNGEMNQKRVEFGNDYIGKTLRDITGHQDVTLRVEEDGWATINVSAGSVSVWVSE